MIQGCHCPTPFTEDDIACSACEAAWIDGRLAADADVLAAYEAGRPYPRLPRPAADDLSGLPF